MLAVLAGRQLARRPGLGNRPAEAVACAETLEETPMPFDEQAAIGDFWNFRQAGDYFPNAWFDRLTLDQAYRIQLGIIARRVSGGEKQIGWKVGLTAPAIQQQFGFHEPVFGCILDRKSSG